MEVLLLKSGACLAILMLFCKLVLENQSFHQFKRFYLLGVITASLIIPFISFTQYVEASSVENLDLNSVLTPYLPIDGELNDIENTNKLLANNSVVNLWFRSTHFFSPFY